MWAHRGKRIVRWQMHRGRQEKQEGCRLADPIQSDLTYRKRSVLIIHLRPLHSCSKNTIPVDSVYLHVQIEALIVSRLNINIRPFSLGNDKKKKQHFCTYLDIFSSPSPKPLVRHLKNTTQTSFILLKRLALDIKSNLYT